MFGLDARIALAIFGALSLITGAALYSAIKQSQATSLLTEMQEIGKAWEAYYLDTGKDLPFLEVEKFFRQTSELVDNTSLVNGWLGPYLKFKKHPLDARLLGYPKYNAIHLLNVKSGVWEPQNWDTEGKCSAGSVCYVWVAVDGIEKTDVISQIDKKIDNGDGRTSGSFRWWGPAADPSYYGVFLKYMPTNNF